MSDPRDPIRVDHWYRDVDCLAALWLWLEEQGREPTDPGYFLQKPWKFEEEWQQYQRDEISSGYAA